MLLETLVSSNRNAHNGSSRQLQLTTVLTLPLDCFKQYGAFDAIAKRRRIFKVETIGDCYVSHDFAVNFIRDSSGQSKRHSLTYMQQFFLCRLPLLVFHNHDETMLWAWLDLPMTVLSRVAKSFTVWTSLLALELVS